MGVKTPTSDNRMGEPRLAAGIVLKPPVRMEELAADVDPDPAEAEALVALMRHMRREGTEPRAEG
jgi:hypothetical protein